MTVTGFFEGDRFIPDTPVSIPQNVKVVVIIDDNNDIETLTLVRNAIDNRIKEIQKTIKTK